MFLTLSCETAIEYAYVLTCSFSGIDPVDSEFQDYKGKYGSKFKAFYNRLTSDKFIPKLKKIGTCENLSFEEVIDKYDSSTTYFYVDPPYFKLESYYTEDEFGKGDHLELLDLLKQTKGKWALSYYHFDELEKMLPRDQYYWHEETTITNNTPQINNTTTNNQGSRNMGQGRGPQKLGWK